MVGGGRGAPQKRGRGKMGFPKKWRAGGIGVSQKQGMRLQRKSQAAWTRNPCYEKNQVTWRCAAKGWRGRPQSPLLASAEAPPCFRKRAAMVGKTSSSVAPIWRDTAQVRKKRLGGAPAGAQSYWQGRFAACAFVGDFLWSGRPRKSWGVAPNPTRELRPLTPQGGFPLDPFLALRLERASHAVPFWSFLPFSLTGTGT